MTATKDPRNVAVEMVRRVLIASARRFALQHPLSSWTLFAADLEMREEGAMDHCVAVVDALDEIGTIP